MQLSYRWVIVAVGALMTCVGIGAMFQLAGGWIFDTFNGHAWPCWGSFAVGLGAVAIALVFPPLPPHRLQPA